MLFSTLLSALTLVTPAQADAQLGKLERVTVYRGQAMAERLMVVENAPLGPLTIQVGPFPMAVRTSSLQAQVERGNAVVQGLEAQLMSGAEQVTRQEAEIAYQRRELIEQLGLQNAEVKALDATVAGLQSMTSRLGEDPSMGGLLIGDLSSRLKALREEMLVTERALVGARLAVSDLEQAIRDLDALSPGDGSRDYREVAISLFVEQAGPVEVRLTYLIDGASWQPAYDLRVAPDLTGLQVNFLGEVKQNTGEDWIDTELVLSTSMPNLGLDPPRVPRRYIAGSTRGRALESLGYVGNEDSMAPSAGLVAADKAFAPTVEVRDFGITTQFVLPGATTLPSTGQTQRFRIRDLPLEVRPERYVVPSLSDKAYLRAEITNTGEVPLMEGSSKVFLGPDYLGEATMPLLRQGDSTMVNLGIDPNLTVKYEIVEDMRDNPGRFSLSSTATITRKYRADLKLSSAARGRIAVLVEEALPMSWNDEFDVSIEGLSPAAEETEDDLEVREERGLYRWRLYISPGATQTVRWGYELSFDEDELPIIRED